MKHSGFAFFEGMTPEGPSADPSPNGGKSPPEAVVPKSEDYDIVREEIPRTSRRSAGRILAHLMNSYVPENPQDYAMDFRLRSRGRRSLATLVIVKKKRLSTINSRFPGAPLWIPPEEGASYDLGGIVVSRGTDSADGGASIPVRPRTPVFSDNLYFPATGRNRPIRTWSLFLLAVLPFAALFGWSVFEKQKTLVLVREASYQEDSVALAEELRQLENLRDDLSGEREALVTARPLNAASFLDVLASEAPEMEIQFLSLLGRDFSIRAQSEDPVSVMKALSGSPFFTEMNLSDMRPVRYATRKSFSLKGVYHGP